jgi:ATP-dependent Clp protease protease subunit
VEQIQEDSDRDRWFSAAEAKDYGFIDEVIDRSALRTGSN